MIRSLVIFVLLASLGLSVAIAQGIIIPIGPGSSLDLRNSSVRPTGPGQSLFLSGQ